MIHAIDGINGMSTAEQAQNCLRPNSHYTPKSSLLCVEQTGNMGGGAILLLKQLDAVVSVAEEANLASQMD